MCEVRRRTHITKRASATDSATENDCACVLNFIPRNLSGEMRPPRVCNRSITDAGGSSFNPEHVSVADGQGLLSLCIHSPAENRDILVLRTIPPPLPNVGMLTHKNFVPISMACVT